MSQRYKKIAFTCYPVQDMARARTFYEKTLGLPPGENFQGVWQEYDFGGTTFAISSMTVDFLKPGSQGCVAIEVEDLKGLVKELREKGAHFQSEEIMESPVCWVAWVKDPDGNTISLHQSK
jgi:predicted enzyme related to lactoylglutathione lyase